MSSVFEPTKRQNHIIRYLDDVVMQDTTTDTMLQTVYKRHQILETENLKTAPDQSFLFLKVKFVGQQKKQSNLSTKYKK